MRGAELASESVTSGVCCEQASFRNSLSLLSPSRRDGRPSHGSTGSDKVMSKSDTFHWLGALLGPLLSSSVRPHPTRGHAHRADVNTMPSTAGNNHYDTCHNTAIGRSQWDAPPPPPPPHQQQQQHQTPVVTNNINTTWKG